MRELCLIADTSGERIDVFLACNSDDLTRSSAQKLLDAGAVLANGHPIKKNYRLTAGDCISVVLPEPISLTLTPQNLPLDIIFEDDDVIAVNKARGMVVHPAPGHPDGTLVNALLAHCGSSLSGIGGARRPGIVHRIDKDTSGLILVAKNDFAHQRLSAQLADHSMFRVYDAVVCGYMKDPSGTIDAPIGRHPTDRKRMAVVHSGGRNAVTHWQVLAYYRNYTYIRCRLETGRTHQIRVHMAHIGHPLAGDQVYGTKRLDKGLSGQCLHARELEFTHPRTDERLHLSCPLPQYFLDFLSHLSKADF